MVQNPAAGIIGGFIKGMKGKAEENAKMRESLTMQTPSEQLESIFLKEPFAEPSIPDLDDPIEELSIGSLSPSLCILKQAFISSAPFPLDLGVLNADDIEIDDEVPVAPARAASSTSQGNKRTAGWRQY